ncbi:conserved hypothetical protein [Verrucomicrobia bacterium]|nr:conserved hypothetical protein [Verrucomicrobiota bacterium]
MPKDHPSRSDPALKPFILAFLFAVVGYAVFYDAIEHRRVRNGPWQVTFTNSFSGPPAIIINQPALGIAGVQVIFPGKSLPPGESLATLDFRQPRPVPYNVPFGKCVFMDTTFLPGTVSFVLFGHEIELLPRVLVIDRQEHAWKSGSAIRVGEE